MQRQIDQVAEFHEMFNVNIEDFPNFPHEKKIQLRKDIFTEEVKELHQAMDERNIVEVADAIIDCMYVLIGTAHEFGLQDILIPMFDEVHRSNMSKLDANAKPVLREDGKVIKSELFTPPDLQTIIVNAMPIQ